MEAERRAEEIGEENDHRVGDVEPPNGELLKGEKLPGLPVPVVPLVGGPPNAIVFSLKYSFQ